MTAASAPVGDSLHLVSSRWWAQLGATLLGLYEIGWVIPWYRSLMDVSVAPPLLTSVLVLGGTLGVTYLAAAVMNRLRLLRNLQLGILIGLLVVGLIVSQAVLVGNEAGLLQGLITLEFGVLVTALVTVWMWWRGFTLLYNGIRPVVVWRRFRLGLGAFMLYVFYAVQWGVKPPGLAWFVAFLFVGLLAVIFTRIAYVWVAKGAQRSPFDRRWLFGILGSLGLVLLISGFIGSLLSGQYRLMLDLASELVRLVTITFLFLLSLPVLLFSFILWPLVAWLDRLMANAHLAPLDLQPAAAPYPYPYPLPESPPSQTMITATSICFWVVFIVVAAVLFLRARRTIVEDYMPEPEAPEFLLGRGEAARMLRKALQDSWDDLLNRFRPGRGWLAVQRIRQIYAQLLDLSAARGQARLETQTPLEFLPVLASAFPGLESETSLITQAYVKIRYGEYPESPEEVRAIERAFQRLKESVETK